MSENCLPSYTDTYEKQEKTKIPKLESKKTLSKDFIDSVTKYNVYDKTDVESVLINTHLVFNTLSRLKETTNSTYNILIASKFLNHNITTTTVKKWLKKNLGLKLTYTTIKTHLEKLEYLGYISKYKKSNKTYRLENEAFTTNKLIYGNNKKDSKGYWIDNKGNYISALISLRYINGIRFSKKAIISEPLLSHEVDRVRKIKEKNDETITNFIDSNNISIEEELKQRRLNSIISKLAKPKKRVKVVQDFKYNKRDIEFNNNFKKQAYTEKEKFTFFADYNTLTSGYGQSKVKLSKTTLRDFQKNKYTSMRTYLDEKIVMSFWYGRPVSKFEIIRVLHTTKDSINQFKCDVAQSFITGNSKQNVDDKFINYKTIKSKRKHEFVKEFDNKKNENGNIIRRKNETDEQLGYRTFNTCIGAIYSKDIHKCQIVVTENVHRHMFYDDNNYITNEEFLQDHKLAMVDTVDNNTKIRFNKETKAKGNVSSIGLESVTIAPNHQKIVESDDSVIVARSRTNNRHLSAFHSSFKSKRVMPKLNDRHFLLYQMRNIKRINNDIINLVEKQRVFELKKSLAISLSNRNN